MPIANMLSITTNPFLSMMIWIVLLLATLYFARKPFHRAVSSLVKIIHNAMRLTATSVLSAEKKLARRNREVLMAAGLQRSCMARNVTLCESLPSASLRDHLCYSIACPSLT